MFNQILALSILALIALIWVGPIELKIFGSILFGILACVRLILGGE